MSEPANGPLRYQVIYSDDVRSALKSLVARARDRGLASQVLDAIKEINRRLELYPQFGEPLLDLVAEPGQIRIGVVPPLVVRYALYEEQRLVWVANPLNLLPRSGV